MEGQYLGPVPLIIPEYIADKCKLSSMTWCLLPFVYLKLHGSRSRIYPVVSKLHALPTSTPGCVCILAQSVHVSSPRCRAPVLSLPPSHPRSLTSAGSQIHGNA